MDSIIPYAMDGRNESNGWLPDANMRNVPNTKHMMKSFNTPELYFFISQVVLGEEIGEGNTVFTQAYAVFFAPIPRFAQQFY